MKIILCIFLLNITAVSVFGQSVPLNGTLGQSVKFPAAVKNGGSLMYGTLPIGEVTSSSFTAPRNEYRGRVQWDSSTGFFSLSGLKMKDSGEYKVQNTDQNIITVFQLNVYKDNVPVSKPHVSVTGDEYPCTLLCTAERGTEATLSWYREGQTKPYSSSSVRSAPHLDLPQTVERSGTYTCEAKNSVSNEKASITVGDHCTAPTSSSTIAAIIIAAVALLIVFGVLCYYIIRRRKALRTLIQVKKLLDNVDLHAYDGTIPPDAVRAFILVKTQLDNVDPHAYGVRTLCRVKMLLDIVDLHDYDETVPPDALRTLIQVKKQLDNVDPHAYGNRSKHPTKDGETMLPLPLDDRRTLIQDRRTFIQGVNTLMQVKKLIDNVDPHAYSVGALIQVKDLIDDVDPRAYRKFIYHPEATEKTTSSHETEVPLNQATREVGEP